MKHRACNSESSLWALFTVKLNLATEGDPYPTHTEVFFAESEREAIRKAMVMTKGTLGEWDVENDRATMLYRITRTSDELKSQLRDEYLATLERPAGS